MNPERWREVTQIYGAVVSRAPEQRATAVAELCGSDDELRREIESLLESQNAASLLNQPPPDLTMPVDHNLTGRTLGPYRLDAPLGAGGMGQVYRAQDTRLNRTVAIKVLAPALAHDAQFRVRFDREARAIAALNHPHICTLHDIGSADGIDFLVMEYVEGDTLSTRLERGAFPLDVALTTAIQVAEALAAAHRHGIVHRDLKPGNIMLTKSGVKLLDFGLAKTRSAGTAGAGVGGRMSMLPTTPAIGPTRGGPLTAQGTILGTLQYMAPEQLEGEEADERTDIFAFGAIVYEMLTGRKAFEGKSQASLIAAIMEGAPPAVTSLQPLAPHALDRLIRTCLAKQRDDRWQSALDLLRELKWIAAAGPDEPDLPRQAPPSTARARILGAVAGVLAIVLAAALVILSRPSPADRAAPARFAFPMGIGQFGLSGRRNVGISPDGRRIVYIADNRLFIGDVSEFEPRPIPGTEGSAFSTPVFSPDGRWIAYQTFTASVNEPGGLRRIAVGGGVPQFICGGRNVFSVSWDAAGILFSDGGRGISRCTLNTDSVERLATVAEREQVDSPQLLPGGEAILFTLANTADGLARWDKAQIVVQTLKSGARKVVVTGGSDARYLPTGHLLYAQSGVVYAVGFDLQRQTVVGDPTPVIEGVRRPLSANTGASQFAVSDSGALAYIPGPTRAASERLIALADRAGMVTNVPVPPGPYVHTRVSRDGAHLAVGREDGREASVWIYDMAGNGAMRRLTLAGRNTLPIWSPDGERLAFQSDREGDLAIFWQRADGTGAAERLTKPAAGEAHIPESFSPDGKYLAFSAFKDSVYSLWMLSMADKKAQATNLQSREPIGAVFSPDGRWLAYSVNAETAVLSPNAGVFVERFPLNNTDRFPVPKSGRDFHPVWSADGSELFYIPSAASGRIAVVSVKTQPAIVYGNPVSLPARVTDNRRSSEQRTFDVLPDGRFVGLVDATDPEASRVLAEPEVRVVLNWFDELKQKVPVPR